MSWQQFLTEKVLGECWHDGTSILMAGYHCKKCDKIFTCNRTFNNRADMMDLYEKIEKDGKLISFLNYLNTACDWKDSIQSEIELWSIYLNGSSALMEAAMKRNAKW